MLIKFDNIKENGRSRRLYRIANSLTKYNINKKCKFSIIFKSFLINKMLRNIRPAEFTDDDEEDDNDYDGFSFGPQPVSTILM
jgi:hypothetical protein